MAKREGMYFYRDWIEPFEALSDSERGKLVLAMMKYAMEGEQPPEFKGLAQMAAMFLFPQIDRSKLCSEAGKKGAEVLNARERESAPQAPKQEAEKKIEKKPEEKKGESEREKRFEEFWREYPKKTGKAEARQVFSEIDPDEALLKKMTDAVKAQKNTRQWKSEEGRFIPSPALWLSRGQWDDEVDIAGESEKTGSFETDDFFEAALRNSYGDELYEKLFQTG